MTHVNADRLAGAGADDWDAHWSSYATSAAANPAQHYRFERAFAHLGRGAAPTRLLDIGCGQGDLLAASRHRWPRAELAGLELSEVGVAETGRKVPGAVVVQRDLIAQAEPHPALAGWATHAVCSEVLEHVDDPVRLLRHAIGHVAPGGTVVVTVPGGPRSAFDRHIGHRRHFTRDSVRTMLTDAGLLVDTVEGAGFPVFNIYKLIVIARGRKLVDDVRTGEDAGGSASGLAARVMHLFGPAFRFARPHSRWGWQLVAVATVPAAPGD